MVILIGFGFYKNKVIKKQHQKYAQDLQALARRHQLEFYPGSWAVGPSVAGTYRSYHINLQIASKKKNGPQFTRVVLEDRRVLSATPSLPEITVADVRFLFNPERTAPKPEPELSPVAREVAQLHGKSGTWSGLEIVDKGRTLTYEQPSITSDINQLQGLFDWLVSAANLYPGIVALGGEAVPDLEVAAASQLSKVVQKLMGDANAGKQVKITRRWLGKVAKQLICDIGKDTQTKLAHRLPQSICTQCLTYCTGHTVELGDWFNSVTYFGCRICHQSRGFYNCSQGVTAVLGDNGGTAPVVYENGLLTVNWLEWRKLFDFDRVAIIHATDEQVERFAVQVGNDTDELRRERYPQMDCTVHPDCYLSANSLKILRRTFGRVEFGDEA